MAMESEAGEPSFILHVAPHRMMINVLDNPSDMRSRAPIIDRLTG